MTALLVLPIQVTLAQRLCEFSNALLSDGFETPFRDTSACREVIAAGEIEQATTWVDGPENCDYQIDGRLAVSAPLTIEPGVTVRLATDARLVLNNTVTAVGRSDQRIVLEGITVGQGAWQGITDNGGSGPLQFEYVDIRDAGGCFSAGCPAAALEAEFADLTLRNSTISGSAQAGLIVDERGTLDFTNNAFCGNADAGVAINPNRVSSLDSDSIYSVPAWPNQFPYVDLDLEADTTGADWPALSVPYYINNFITVDSGILTLAPGAAIVFRQDIADDGGRLRVVEPGLLVALGTPDQPIEFRGDPAQAGNWRGLRLDDTGLTQANRLSHVLVEGGGTSSVAESAGIQINNDTLLELDNVRIERSATWGIGCSEDAPVFDLFEITLGENISFGDNNGLGNIDPDCTPGLQ